MMHALYILSKIEKIIHVLSSNKIILFTFKFFKYLVLYIYKLNWRSLIK